MKTLAAFVALTFALVGPALGWGPEGHSIVAEIAQQRLSPQAAAMVEKLLGKGRSLASVASWADDVRNLRPDTENWHFVDIPIHANDYEPKRDCKDDVKGDCVIKALARLRSELRCTSGTQQVEALKFAVHFIGDIHQPLHTVLEARGGNDIPVKLTMHGRKCAKSCNPPVVTNFHAAWDVGLIQQTVWDWGAYVDLIEKGWLQSADAKSPGIDGGKPEDWAVETHKAAQTVWAMLPAGEPLDEAYYDKVAPILDRQFGVAGLRLAKFLNDAYASNVCPVQ